MSHFAVSAMGADRPGIVAAVTGALVELGANLDDCSMTILRGHFAMMIVVETPPATTAEQIEAAVLAPTRVHDLVVAVRAIDDDVPESPAGRSFSLSLHGADRPGIVHRVASLLASESVNIVDLTTRVIGEPGRPVYAMTLDVTLPNDCDPDALAERLGVLASELDITCRLHPGDADIL
ncbi:MAG: glycine cleavage system transcriptional repressor [Acidimicrobiales bacterium]